MAKIPNFEERANLMFLRMQAQLRNKPVGLVAVSVLMLAAVTAQNMREHNPKDMTDDEKECWFLLEALCERILNDGSVSLSWQTIQ